MKKQSRMWLHLLCSIILLAGPLVVSLPDCLGGVCRQRQLNINAVQLAQCENRFRGSGFCYCIIEASTFNLHL